MTQIVLNNSCKTVEAKSFVITKEMVQNIENQNTIVTIGYTYIGDQVEMKLFLSREIRDKNGAKVKSLCIMNALTDAWKVKINDSLIPVLVLPRSTKKDLDLIKVDDADANCTYLIQFEKCTEEEMKNHIDSSQLEQTRRIWMKIYKSDKFHDAVISTSDGHKVRLHRFALACASPVLRAVFTHGAEAGNGVLRVPDIDKETIDVIVRYIYCGLTTVHSDLVEKVLFAAEKYDLKALKKAAEEKLCLLANASNAIHYMKLSEMFQLEKLKKKCDLIVATDDFINARTYESIEDVGILKNILKNRISEKQ